MTRHASDCAMHNGPALPPGECDCSGIEYTEAREPHDEQVQVWEEEVASVIEPWLKQFEGYDDGVAFHRALRSEIKFIAEAAHAAGMERAKRA